MRLGRLPQNTFDRLMFKSVRPAKKGSKQMRVSGGAAIRDNQLIASSQVIMDTLDEVRLCFYRALSAVKAQGKPEAVLITIGARRRDSETRIKAILVFAEELCENEGLEFYPGCIQVLGDQRTVTITVLGEKENRYKPKAGDSIIVAGYAGSSGAGKAMLLCRERLSQRFTKSWMENADARLFTEPGLILSVLSEDMFIQPMAEGGLLAGLWDMKERIGKGFSIDMLNVPIRQETVEICEELELNPYQLTSDGAFIIVTADEEGVAGLFEEKGIPFEVIGTVSQDKECALYKKMEKTCLDRPEQDGIWQFFNNYSKEEE